MNLFHEHETYTRPFAKSKNIIGESFMPLYKEGESGELTIPMMNTIEKIIEVRRTDRSETYTEGKDYILRDGKLVIPENSSIRIMSWEEYCPKDSSDDAFASTTSGNLIFLNVNEFHTMQYEITYDAADNCFDGKYFPVKSPLLNRTREILKSGKPLKLAFTGDSITYGCNVSGLYGNLPPHMPVYPKLVAETLEKRGHKIHYYNNSIGGITSAVGAEMAERTIGNFAPDTLVIAYGMNDANKEIDISAEYAANIKKIIGVARKSNPLCEIILVTTTLANPLSVRFNRGQDKLEAPLVALSKEEGTSLLNMTEIHRFLLTRKEYHHMTGNNINHPNDFLARFYTQGILELIGE